MNLSLKFLKILFLTFWFNYATAQVAGNASDLGLKPGSPGPVKAAAGTFQIIKIGVKSATELFTDDLLFFIETKRDDSKEVVEFIGKNTKVRILSRKDITDPAFVPLSDEVLIEGNEQ